MDDFVVVVGSANLDLVLSVTTIPASGETVLARSLSRGAGGKGLNQAVAAARAGAGTAFIGAVGNDDAATELVADLSAAGVETSHLSVVSGPSGTAVVVVDDAGENSIVVAPGANDSLTALSTDQLMTIRRAAVLVVQLEIPLVTVSTAIYAAHKVGARVILNAAPAQPLPVEMLSAVDLLVVNQGEACVLVDTEPMSPASHQIDALLSALLETVPAVVITLGREGSAYAERSGSSHRIPAVPVDVVDTTGAGDTFTGALAATLARGEPVLDALQFASAAAAAAVTRRGAVRAIPHRAEVDRMLAEAIAVRGAAS
jgi:ribokinase